MARTHRHADHLRNVIGWRGLAQRDPLNEYKSEAFQLFGDMTARLRQTVTGNLMRVEVVFEQPQSDTMPDGAMAGGALAGGSMPAELAASPTFAAEQVIDAGDRDPNDPTTWGKVGRNEACPCGSGKKFKHCHGQYA